MNKIDTEFILIRKVWRERECIFTFCMQTTIGEVIVSARVFFPTKTCFKEWSKKGLLKRRRVRLCN